MRRRFTALRAALVLAAPLALATMLTGCGEDGAGSAIVVPAPLPSTPGGTPTPTPTPTAITYDVQNCFTQSIPGQTGKSASIEKIIFPDTVKLDLTRPTRFPNGRHPSDPVVDLLIAALFLDVNATGQGPDTLAKIPLDPPANDKPFSLTFPFLAAPNGAPQRASGTGSGFDFRTDADSAYTIVDRMGNPAIATVLIPSPEKVHYNDDNPSVDVTRKYKPAMDEDLEQFFGFIGDDLEKLGLKICATHD